MNVGLLSNLIQENSINNNKLLGNSLNKLSTGLKINKASDDASGLAIADKLRTQVSSINQAIANGNSAISLIQIADKSMAEQSNILDIVKSKLIQANTDTTSDEGRETIRQDISKLLDQLDNIAAQTNYNGKTLLQADSSDTDSMSGLSFQVGEKSSDIISVGTIQANTVGLGGDDAGEVINETISYLSSYTASGSDEKFNITVSGTGGLAVQMTFHLDISNVGTITINTAMQLEAGDNLTAWMRSQNGNSSSIPAGKTFDLSTYSGLGHEFSIAVGTSGVYNISMSGVDILRIDNSTGNNMIINGSKNGNSLLTLKSLGENTLTKEKAGTYQAVVDDAITKLNEYRGEMGSTQNQIESAVRNLMTQSTNIKSAESIIRDVDYAVESANFNKLNIITQAGNYALSQALQIDKQIITQLLK